MPLEPWYVAMTPSPTQVSLTEQHHQLSFVDCGTQAIALHHMPRAVLHTSARAALDITVLKIVPGICLANRVLSPNSHPPLLHISAASPGDCECFECVWILFLAIP